MKKILIITLLIGLGLGGLEFVALPNEAEAGTKDTVVKFEIYQTYLGGGWSIHRLWAYGVATHWNPDGRSTQRGFWHRHNVPERVDFGRQLLGNSRGRADIRVGLVCRPSRCTSGIIYYRVSSYEDPLTIYPTVKHPK